MFLDTNGVLITKKKMARVVDSDDSDASSITDPFADSGSSYVPSDLEESSNGSVGMFL